METTTIYLIRHSTKFSPKCIDTYNSNDSNQLKTEKKMLSVEGEERAKILSNEKEFENIDVVYSSDYVRSMQTAKYFLKKNNLMLNVDRRFNEINKGTVDKEKYPDFFVKQYWDKELKMPDGESQLDVCKRMTEAFWEVVNNNKGKQIVIVSHGTAISFLLMNWCKLLDMQENYLRKLEFNNKVIINRIFKFPEVFKVTIGKNNDILDIENLEFKDLK
ncbi:MAG: histidine phosphatase family protein [Clostridia bacterium]|nr:histidine phosphatase family protein [Clostridia bacterium]